MQDGVGTHRTTAEESALVYAALAPVCKKHGARLWADVEIFDQTHGSPVDDKGWSAKAAPLDRVLKQADLASPYVEKTIIFEYLHYMSPRLKQPLYKQYRGTLPESLQ
jgi:hypothetical protein